jgi:predicted RNA binding protein YcfA (HicA-like mRNA interferase family)
VPRLPQVSGSQLIALLESLGYRRVRQRGSHAQLRLETDVGQHTITVPLHKAVAKGTLNDILSRVAPWAGVAKEELIERLR